MKINKMKLYFDTDEDWYIDYVEQFSFVEEKNGFVSFCDVAVDSEDGWRCLITFEGEDNDLETLLIGIITNIKIFGRKYYVIKDVYNMIAPVIERWLYNGALSEHEYFDCFENEFEGWIKVSKKEI